MVNPCGFFHLVCSVPDCGSPYELYRPTEDDFLEPLCPQHKRLRLLEDEGCAAVGEELEAS